MLTKQQIADTLKDAPFGLCPWCGSPMAWDNDEEWVEDPAVTIRYLHCPHCGADIEAMQCIQEERHNYPDYWGENYKPYDTEATD